MNDITTASVEQDQQVEVTVLEEKIEAAAELTPREGIYKKYDEARKEEEAGAKKPEVKAEAEVEEPSQALKDQIDVVINGKKRKVPREKVDKAGGIVQYQKLVAADEGLRELAEERKRFQAERNQLEAQRKQLQHMQAQVQQQPRVAPPGKDVPPSNDLELDEGLMLERAKKYRDSLYEGKDEDADKIFVESMKSAVAAARRQVPTQSIDPREVENRVMQQIEWRMRNTQVAKAQAEFREEFADIASDPQLFKLADAETVTLMEQHPNWTPDEIIREAGSRIRAWNAERAAQSSGGVQAQKRRLSGVYAGTARSKAPTQPKPMSRSEYVAKLRESRNLGN